MVVERGLALFFFIGSAAYLYGATGLALGTLSAPKAGFLPTIIGTLAMVLSALDLIKTLRAAPREPPETKYGRAFALVAVMAAYIVTLPFLGFFASTTVSTFLLLKISQARGYVVPAIIAVALAGATQVGFGTFLNLQLP